MKREVESDTEDGPPDKKRGSIQEKEDDEDSIEQV